MQLREKERDAVLSPAAQAQVIATALKDVTEAEPYLPFPGSVLPSLLAMRKTHSAIVESGTAVSNQTAAKDSENRQLEADLAILKDQNLLTDALTARIETLKKDLNSNADLAQEDAAREKLAELREKQRVYDKENIRLFKALRGFINNELAALLAAEELGGPVVGDLMDIDAEDLAGGFTAQGKLKRAGKGDGGRDKRQRRIDEIWGNPDDDGRRQRPADEVEASAAEMRGLTEDLLNKLKQAEGDNSASYVTIDRESAAARFLIRSKVAQFHPKDATRIRLIDFGRELEE